MIKQHITVKVSSTHIIDGVPNCKTQCMLVHAIEARLPTVQHVQVGDGFVRFTDRRHPDQRLQYRLDPVAVKAIQRFDEGLSVQPFTTTLAWPSWKPATWLGQRKPTAKRVHYTPTGASRYNPPKNRISGRIVP